MSDEIAEIIGESGVNIEYPNDHHLWATELSNKYFVSTIRRTEMGKGIDDALAALMKLHKVKPHEIGHIGELDMEGDYETMVFLVDEDGHRGSTEQAFARYSTIEEAEAGHKEMVERWRRMPQAEEDE